MFRPPVYRRSLDAKKNQILEANLQARIERSDAEQSLRLKLRDELEERAAQLKKSEADVLVLRGVSMSGVRPPGPGTASSALESRKPSSQGSKYPRSICTAAKVARGNCFKARHEAVMLRRLHIAIKYMVLS